MDVEVEGEWSQVMAEDADRGKFMVAQAKQGMR